MMSPVNTRPPRKPYGFTASTGELTKAFGDVVGIRKMYTNADQVRFANGEQWLRFGIDTCYKPYHSELDVGGMESTLQVHNVVHTLKKKIEPALYVTPIADYDCDPREAHFERWDWRTDDEDELEVQYA